MGALSGSSSLCSPEPVPVFAHTGDDPARVAALYVETAGCYSDLENVDPWDINRDARNYSGPHPVVAHPPCQRWGAMAFVNYARWGGEHNRPGNDGGCFAAALNAVRTWGGVLEHPARSHAWKAHGLMKPPAQRWQKCFDGGWVCEVWQSAYGHRANKATWLYYFGSQRPPDLRWARLRGSHQIGFHDQRGKSRNKPTLSKREASATPEAFRDVLLSIARTAILAEASMMNATRHIDNAYQRIDMAMGLIALGKAHALLGEALHELHLAIATGAGTAETGTGSVRSTPERNRPDSPSQPPIIET